MSGQRILIVDDNPVNIKLVAYLLQAAGYVVLTAEDADAALALLLGADLPHLILMDVQLPGIDGLELTRRLKNQERTRQIPIVALTASAMKGDEQRAREAGCDGYISKPIDTRRFVQTVADYFPGA